MTHSNEGRFEPAMTEEQHRLLVECIFYDYVKKRKLSKLGIRGVARDLHERKDDDGNYMWLDCRDGYEGKLVTLETFRKNVDRIVRDWKTEMRHFLQYDMVEAVAAHAEKAADSPSSLKAVAPIIEPERKNESDKPALPSFDVEILHRDGVGTAIRIGKDAMFTQVGHPGHEHPDTVHPVADGQQKDTVTQALPRGNDTVVHGVHQGGYTAQGNTVPDTEVPPEDAVDNDGGDDMGSA